MAFKGKTSLERRKVESARIRKKYPHRVPVIVEEGLSTSSSAQAVATSLWKWMSSPLQASSDATPTLVSSRIVTQTPPPTPTPTPTPTYNKFLVPTDLTLGQFIYVFRKKVPTQSDQALFFSIGGQMLGGAFGMTMGQLDKENKDEDGFLYIRYQHESTFGACSRPLGRVMALVN